MRRRGFLVLLATASCKPKPFACTDVAGLSADDAQARVTLGYSDSAANPNKTCIKCQQFIATAEGCGSCKVLKGPIHPSGTCKVYALKS
jgi:hypothetical protein